MDHLYEHLENYEDVNKIQKIKLENRELKEKLEEYTTTIAKLQRDFDNLAAEHRKLEQNYSSLLKTARAEIERKTQMIKTLNVEKDKLMINARQNRNKVNYRYKRIEAVKSKNSRSSDSTVQEQSDEVISKIHNPNTYCKNDNVPSAHSFIHGKTDPNIDKERNNLDANNQNLKSCVSKENNMQVLNKLDNRPSETTLKKITNRRKSMPLISSNDVKFSSSEDCGNSIESEVSKKNYQSKEDTLKRFVERNYNGNRISETSSMENYSRHYDNFIDKYSNKRTTGNNSRDRYESSYRKRDKYSPERYYQTGTNSYRNDYYQRYDYSSRQAYESPPHEKSYHNSRSRDRRSNYDRDLSYNCTRNRNDDERYVEKHKLVEDIDEPGFKRQKFEHGYRYQNYNRWQEEQDYSKRTVYAPSELREQFSCQSPDHVYNDNFIPADKIKEIKYTASVPLEDPRLASKKYKTVSCSDKKFITTITGRNVDILPVNKIAWGCAPVPMPKLLLEPPESFSENRNKNYNFEIHSPSPYNLRKKSPTSRKVVNRSDNPQINNLMSSHSGTFRKCVQKSAVDNKIVTDNALCKDGKQNEKTIKDNNNDAGLETSLGGKNRKMDENIGAHVDKIVKENMCDSINMDVLKEILKESSKDKFSQAPNSMPRFNINPLKKEKTVDSEIIQNICPVASLGNMTTNTKTEKTVGAHLDKINKDNEYKNSNVDMVKEIVSTSKEGSKNQLTTELNSMPKLNLNTVSLKEENSVNKELQNINDNKNNEGNNIEDKHFKFDLIRNVEDDLILSDETSDAFETSQKSTKKDTKTKTKKKKEPESSNKTEIAIATKAKDFVDKKKQRVLKDKETTPEQPKRQKSKKKTLENRSPDSDQLKVIKTNKSKKEKDIKTDEIKSKFSELFGDSTSLISTDDLVVTHRYDISNEYDTIYEDTQAAVDLNLTEIEKNQTSIIGCQNAQNNSLNDKIDVKANFSETVPDSSTINGNKNENNEKIDSNNIIIPDNVVTDTKCSVIDETLSLPNINGKIDEESPDIVKMVIISSGRQPQNTTENDEDFIQPRNVVKSSEDPIKIVALHALATSTPAKTFTDNTIAEHVFSKTPENNSNNTSSINSDVLSTPMDQSSGTRKDSEKSEDVPDVRIFVKRRRKIKK